MAFKDFEAFETGHPEIDEDHRRLANTIEMINRAMAAGSAEMCNDFVRLFLAAVATHFEREEKLLRELGYPGADEHAAFHADLLERAREMSKTCENVPPAEFQACFDRIVAFFVEDVVRGDHAFHSWFQEMGITGRPLHRR